MFRNSKYRVLGYAVLVAIVAAVLQSGALSGKAAQEDAGRNAPETSEPPAAAPSGSTTPKNITDPANFFNLLVLGGWIMIPIGIVSLIAVTCTIERFINVRRSRVIPDELLKGLAQLGNSSDGFDPRKAYRLCQKHPSAASKVVRAMLLKVGRPHGEIEHAVAEASQREADRMYANVRWINLAVSVAPLLGLLGTVWGIIDAFYGMTQLAPGQNRAVQLAGGIYTALVTTLGGLLVAIPAAVIAHMLEGRIQRMFHDIDEMVFDLLAQVERFEGRVRFSRPSSDNDVSHEPVAAGAGASR
jgi:biopolymer transport protein ExbB